ncbi:MAG: NAD-dependent epimerase/dehydratase family protein [Solirubrobacterales bacterium]
MTDGGRTGGRRTGRVAITGASGQVGSLLQKEMRALPNEVVPLNRGDDWSAGIDNSEVVVHLAGALVPGRGSSFEQANVETAKTVAGSIGPDTERIVFLSYVGASADSPNRYLRSKFEAEQVLAETRRPLTVFRCLHIFGPPDAPGPTIAAFLAKEGKSKVTVLGSGRQRIEPVYIGDVVDGILASALDPATPTGTFELGGPERMSMDGLVKTVNSRNEKAVKVGHVPTPIARLLGHLSPSLNPSLVDLLVEDNLASGSHETAGIFDLELHGPTEVWEDNRTPGAGT